MSNREPRSMLGRSFSGENPPEAPWDQEIVEQIYELLRRRSDVEVDAIHVTFWDGEVTLRGTVANDAARQAVESSSKSVAGVMKVRNEVRVKDDRIA